MSEESAATAKESEEKARIDELKKQKALLDAQKELLDAQKATADSQKLLVDSQKALAEAQKVTSASAMQHAEQVAQAKAAKDVADAQKAAADARNALAEAQKAGSASAIQTAEQAAQAKAAKDLADAQKAAADARKAQSEAQLAAFKTAIGEVPDSGIKGIVTTGEKAGELEAALLAMKAVREAARTIGQRVRGVLPDQTPIVVICAGEVPTFQHLMAYDAEVAIIHKVLDMAMAAAAGTADESTEAVPVLGAAGLALDATSKLLSFFRTDVTVTGVDVTVEDVVALNEVANDLAQLKEDPLPPNVKKVFRVKAPSIFDRDAITNKAQFFLKDAEELSDKRLKLEAFVAVASRNVAELTKKLAAADLDADTKPTLESQLSAQTALLASLKSAATLLDAWYTKLGTADSKGVAAIVNMTKEKSIADGLTAGGSLLVVKVQKAGGGVLTKRNLLTSLWKMPLFHMGGAAVSFTLIDGKDGLVKAAGVVPIHGGFVEAGMLRRELDRQPDAERHPVPGARP